MQLVQEPCLKNSCKGERGTESWGAGGELLAEKEKVPPISDTNSLLL